MDKYNYRHTKSREIMCLYPRLIKNPKYKANKKNGGDVPVPIDNRVLWVPIGCGKCMECLKKRSNEWKVRIAEDIKTNTNGKFVTLTFDTESLCKITSEITDCDGYDRDNAVAKLAVRRFLERWRWKYKKSVRHWLVTELGQTSKEHLHIHGIIWTDETEDIKNIWQYGYVFIGGYVNEKTVNYITKYVNKADLLHKEYKPIILTSAGIGSNYTNTPNAKRNKYKEGNTEERYVNRNGTKTNLPMYLRNKIYTEEEREKLWIEKLDKKERWVGGVKIDVSTEKGIEVYQRVLKETQKKNQRLGYGNDEINWDQRIYERNRRNMIMEERIEKENKKMEGRYASNSIGVSLREARRKTASKTRENKKFHKEDVVK